MNVKAPPVVLMLLGLVLAGCSTRYQAPSPTTAAPILLTPQPVISTTITPSATLTVIAAISLEGPFTELGQLFEAAHPGTKVLFTYPDSLQPGPALSANPQADVFASDSSNDMQAMQQSGQVAKDSGKFFAENKLVVIFPASNPGKILKLQDLAKPGLKLSLAGDSVPLGMYTLSFLSLASFDAAFSKSFQTDVQNNVVSLEENSQAVVTRVAAGLVDAGICYLSDVPADLAANGGMLPIPDTLNVVALYSIAVLVNSQDSSMAQAFVDLVLTGAGQQVMMKYGFIPTNP